MDNLTYRDKQRIVHRRILSMQVKSFNAKLFALNGNKDNYSKLFSKLYYDVYGEKQDLNLLSTTELRRLSFILFYAEKLFDERVKVLEQEYLDFSPYITYKNLSEMLDKSILRAKLLYNENLDNSINKDIAPVIKQFDKELSLKYIPIQTKFVHSNKKEKEQRLEKALSYYNFCFNDFVIQLSNLNILESEDIKDIVNELNKNFFCVSNVSTFFEPHYLIEKNVSPNVLFEEYLRANAFKLEEATALLKKLKNANLYEIKEQLSSCGFTTRTKYNLLTGNLPEMTDGFINSFALTVQYEKLKEFNYDKLNEIENEI